MTKVERIEKMVATTKITIEIGEHKVEVTRGAAEKLYNELRRELMGASENIRKMDKTHCHALFGTRMNNG